jgi:hypothetical protein
MILTLITLLLPSLALAIPSPAPAPFPPQINNPLRIPLKAHHFARQYHPDLPVRQEWLKSEGRGIRRKYARHLGEEGVALVKREQEEVAGRLAKRASGNATLVNFAIGGNDADNVKVVGRWNRCFILWSSIYRVGWGLAHCETRLLNFMQNTSTSLPPYPRYGIIRSLGCRG